MGFVRSVWLLLHLWGIAVLGPLHAYQLSNIYIWKERFLNTRWGGSFPSTHTYYSFWPNPRSGRILTSLSYSVTRVAPESVAPRETKTELAPRIILTKHLEYLPLTNENPESWKFSTFHVYVSRSHIVSIFTHVKPVNLRPYARVIYATVETSVRFHCTF